MLTWAIIPIVQNYCVSGYFTVLSRLKNAVKELWRFYLIIGLVAVIGVVVAAAFGKLKLTTLPRLIITLSNAYGLLIVIALLGYGLVEVPRILWRRSFPEKRLFWHWHRVGRSSNRLEKATKELSRCIQAVAATSQQITNSNKLLRSKIEVLVAYLKSITEIPFEEFSAFRWDVDSLTEDELDYASDIQGLSRLHKRLKLAVTDYIGTKGEFVLFLRKSIDLEAICRIRKHGLNAADDFRNLKWYQVLTLRYNSFVRPLVQRIEAVLTASLSLIIVWCEATISWGQNPDLSPISILIHSPSVISSPWLLQSIVGLTLLYVVIAAYFSLFRLGGLGPYHMILAATGAWSLLLNGSLLARFAAPLAFNYLHVIRMANWKDGSRSMSFVRLMKMEDVPLFGTAFNTWFPIVLVIYTALLSFNLYESCVARYIIPSRLRFDSENCDDIHTARGQALVTAELDALQDGYKLGDKTCLMFGQTNSSYNPDENFSFPTLRSSRSQNSLLATNKSFEMSKSSELGRERKSSSNILIDETGKMMESDSADLLFSAMGRKG